MFTVSFTLLDPIRLVHSFAKISKGSVVLYGHKNVEKRGAVESALLPTLSFDRLRQSWGSCNKVPSSVLTLSLRAGTLFKHEYGWARTIKEKRLFSTYSSEYYKTFCSYPKPT